MLFSLKYVVGSCSETRDVSMIAAITQIFTTHKKCPPKRGFNRINISRKFHSLCKVMYMCWLMQCTVWVLCRLLLTWLLDLDFVDFIQSTVIDARDRCDGMFYQPLFRYQFR